MPSPRYSRIAGAEVSEIRRNSDALAKKSPTAGGALILPGAMALVFAQKFGFKFGLRVIG
jgi:hypothetical protein